MKANGFIFMMLVAVLCACGHGNPSQKAADFTDTVYKPVYANGFEILAVPGGRSTVLSVSNPWQGNDSVVSRLFIARNGEIPPADFDGQILKGDAGRIIVMSSTNLAALEALGVPERVVGVSGKRFISSKWLAENGETVKDVGYDGNIDFETMVAARPDLVLLYGVSGPSLMEPKLRELKIPFVYVADYLEESPLGKAEWLVALAELAGVRAEGERLFAGIPEKYNALKAIVDSADIARPTVMLNAPYGDAWFLPSGDTYFARLLADAGADYLNAAVKGNESKPVSLEKAYSMISAADFWLNPGRVQSLEQLKLENPRFADAPSVVNGRVFNNNRRSTPGGGNDFFESGIVNPHSVLADLIRIFHPELLPDSQFVYYKQL